MNTKTPSTIAARTIVAVVFILSSAIFSGCSKTHKSILVEQIEITPNSLETIVGQSLDVSISTLPANATNAGELTVSATKPEIATYENGKVTGVSAGSTTLTAICGAVRNTANIKVYWYLTKNNTSYPIKDASGYKYFMGSPEVDAYDVTFSDGTERLRIWIPAKVLGKTIDVSKPLPELDEDHFTCFLDSHRNENEDEISLWMNETSAPIFRNNEWDILPITATGTFCLNFIPSVGYVADVDVHLSNGQKWFLHYEGPIATKDEGDKS